MNTAPCLIVSPLGNPCDKRWGHTMPHHYAYGGVWETWADALARLSNPKEPKRCPTCGSADRDDPTRYAEARWDAMRIVAPVCPDPWHQSHEGSDG